MLYCSPHVQITCKTVGGLSKECTQGHFCYRQAVQTAAVHAVVRYNQRGVGSSSGFKSFWGSQDMADAVSVCQQILAWKDGPTHLHVIG